jgi:hypothetical protein
MSGSSKLLSSDDALARELSLRVVNSDHEFVERPLSVERAVASGRVALKYAFAPSRNQTKSSN